MSRSIVTHEEALDRAIAAKDDALLHQIKSLESSGNVVISKAGPAWIEHKQHARRMKRKYESNGIEGIMHYRSWVMDTATEQYELSEKQTKDLEGQSNWIMVFLIKLVEMIKKMRAT